jgi:hypothetical protein
VEGWGGEDGMASVEMDFGSRKKSLLLSCSGLNQCKIFHWRLPGHVGGFHGGPDFARGT